MTKLDPLLIEGMLMAVIRPKDPGLAIEAARKVAEDQNLGLISRDEAHSRFNEILSMQEYTFLGLLGPKQEVLDQEGNVIGQMQPGDSFVPYTQLAAAAEVSDAMKAVEAKTEN